MLQPSKNVAIQTTQTHTPSKNFYKVIYENKTNIMVPVNCICFLLNSLWDCNQEFSHHTLLIIDNVPLEIDNICI